MRIILAAAAVVALSLPALAQTPSANPQAPSNPAVSTDTKPKPGAPAPGANSFTEAQAKSRIEGQGFTGVGTLAKDADGIWRGTATKDGKTVNVSVDYQGNVVGR